MYLPEHFKVTDLAKISELIAAYPLAMLITISAAGEPLANHLPLLLDGSVDQGYRLLGHMARANPQWQDFSTSHEVLVTFQGPHAYVSPSWYKGSGVPTWNYAVVQVRGRPKIIDDETALEALLKQLTDSQELQYDTPWNLTLTDDQRTKLLGMIVGFEIEITEIVGKFKLSQNRPLADQQGVVDVLAQSSNFYELEIAQLMQNNLSI
ncbi:FMN-binding negative transcriptional regulator [Sulfuriferula nivalis]|uniref:Transcriptional regulator n=1 Tax=Sulfuriferula nivalis TaxID=2675298 RepID=A0A809S4W0_9PROT|nr:FMN-binding negative transcriptional regulator [Sulfuriferula nivalis]BBP02118.1 transcriptional regulator [Sulfuriferula nivalis]